MSSVAELYRQVRDSHRAVWEPASLALAEQSEENPEAFAALRELLISALPELRVRGVVGLGALASLRPEEVTRFLEDRLAEHASLEDPILLEAILGSVARLPNPDLLSHCLTDERVPVRVAALGSLEGRTRWPLDALRELVQDPSVEVRATLALLLAARPEDGPVSELLGRLLKDSQAQVRAALAAGLRGDGMQARFLRMTLETDLDARVREALRAQPGATSLREDAERPGLQTALGLEAEIDRRPQDVLELLRPWLGRGGTLDLLRALSELCRDPQAGRLVAGLHVLLASSDDDPQTRMLRMLGILEGAPASSPAAELMSLVAACLAVLETTTTEALVKWSQSVQVPTAVSLDANAWDVVSRLARFCRGLGPRPGLLPLSKAVENVENLLQAGESCLRPECELLQPALANAVRVLSDQMNNLMAGVDN